MTRFHRKSKPRRRAIPAVWLMTDERIAIETLLRAVARLPRGAAVIVRHYSLAVAERRLLFGRIVSVARRRGVLVLLAGSVELARRWGADGHHGHTPAPRSGKPWLHSAPVHNHAELVAAERACADAVLLSPLLATRSHPGARPLGAYRFAALARASSVPVIALGGVKRRHVALLRRLGAAGFAAIDSLTSELGSGR